MAGKKRRPTKLGKAVQCEAQAAIDQDLMY
jgi:hypothetical protein